MFVKVLATAAILIVLMAMACAKNKPSATAKDEAANSVGILFSVDGVTVYRFGDGERYHYFAVRDGRPDTVTLTSWSETRSCGRNCTRQERFEEQVAVLDARARTASRKIIARRSEEERRPRER